MTGLALILGVIFGGLVGYFVGVDRGFKKGKNYIIEKKRRYDRSR